MERLTERYDITPDGESDVWVKQHDYISAVRKLCDYEDLEEQGLLVRLPCKVGTEVFVIFPGINHYAKCQIKKIEIKPNIFEKICYFIEPVVRRGQYLKYFNNKFGETIFLTREEAEKKLKEMKEEYRGMRPKKYILRSSVSGGGKTRNSLADGCNMVSDRIYDWNKKEWISTGDSQPVLFISTELEKEEIQDIILAHVSGIEQERIEIWDDITPEEEKILNESAKYIETYEYYVEYMPDFTIDLISETIEKYILNYKIVACFFDYINDSPSLYEYYYNKTHTRLRTDQILFLFSESLKLVCNKFNIYLGSSTQLNDNYKEDGNKDAGALKGSKAIIEKADGGILALPVTHKDLKKLRPILESNGSFGKLIPNMSYYIFKNRGGKWHNIIIWTKLNMGTMREVDCFVTNYNYELITDIEQTLIDFKLDDVGDVGIIETDVDISGSDLAMELSKSI